MGPESGAESAKAGPARRRPAKKGRAKRLPNGTGQAEENSALPALKKSLSGSKGQQFCVVCTNTPEEWAFGSCGHVVCGPCCHRMRVLYKDEACVMCKTVLPSVVVLPVGVYEAGMEFEEALERFKGLFLDSKTKMRYLDRSRMNYFKTLRSAKCPVCKDDTEPSKGIFSNLSQLKAHLRSEHQAQFCDICLTFGKAYKCEMDVYPVDQDKKSSRALRNHIRSTHPYCQFCKKHFYDDDMLYEHLTRKHETCVICGRNGRLHEYYRNFQELEAHYRSEHFVCENESCRGEVFATVLDLQAHNLRVHGMSRGRPVDTGPRSRVTVDLQQLHEGRARRQGTGRRENDARLNDRRTFTAENVIFSGTGGSAISREGIASESTQRNTTRIARNETEASRVGSEREESQASELSSAAYRSLATPASHEEGQIRNRLFVKLLRSLLDPASYELFRQAGGQFRDGSMLAQDFYQVIIDACGVKTAESKVFPELIALLPDADKRQELERIVIQHSESFAAGLHAQLPPLFARDGAFPSLPGDAARRSGQPAAAARPIPIRAPRREDFPQLTPTTRRSPSPIPNQRARSTAVPSNPINLRRIFQSPLSDEAVEGEGSQAQRPAPYSQYPPLVGSSRSQSAQGQEQGVDAAEHGSGWGIKQNTGARKKRTGKRQSDLLLSSSAFPPLGNRGHVETNTTPEKPRQVRGSNRPNLARDMQEKLTLGGNALPKVGGSGYGFAWDRKKIRALRREVRTKAASEVAGSKTPSRMKYEDYLKSTGEGNVAATSAGEDTNGVTSEPPAEAVGSQEKREENALNGDVGVKGFDEFSYLNAGETFPDEATLSFFQA